MKCIDVELLMNEALKLCSPQPFSLSNTNIQCFRPFLNKPKVSAYKYRYKMAESVPTTNMSCEEKVSFQKHELQHERFYSVSGALVNLFIL